MKTVNALAVRKSLGAVLDQLEKGGEPVIVTRDRKPVAALVSIETFNQRFVDFLSQDKIKSMLALVESRRVKPVGPGSSLDELRRLRDSLD